VGREGYPGYGCGPAVWIRFAFGEGRLSHRPPCGSVSSRFRKWAGLRRNSRAMCSFVSCLVHRLDGFLYDDQLVFILTTS
jgi:hypothetical protein